MSNQNQGVMTWDDCVNKKSQYETTMNHAFKTILEMLNDPGKPLSESNKTFLNSMLERLYHLKCRLEKELGPCMHHLVTNNPIQMAHYPLAYFVESTLSNAITEVNTILEKVKNVR